MADRQSFVATLRSEREAFARFLGLLESESAALLRGDVEDIVRLSAAKTTQVEALTALSEQRLEQLRAEGFTPDRIGMSEWLIVHGNDDHASLSRLWEDLLKDAGEARRLNENNGVMIDARLRFNRAALSTLRGAMHHQVPVYGPDGSHEFHSQGRPLGLA
ncbi:MAG: flagellar protein FlgN [Burkholderiales bacterium]